MCKRCSLLVQVGLALQLLLDFTKKFVVHMADVRLSSGAFIYIYIYHRYPGSGDFTVALVGSHMDVVPAVPEEWERDPFKLSKWALHSPQPSNLAQSSIPHYIPTRICECVGAK
jgi:hypothetical protein